MKFIVPICVLLLAAAVATTLIRFREEVVYQTPEPLLPVVRVQSVAREAHRFVVAAQGVVQPRVEIQLTTEVTGRVVEVAPGFAAGGFFEQSEVLVRLDARDYELALARAKAGLAEASVRLQREEAEAQVAREEWEALSSAGWQSGSSSPREPSPLLLREPQLAEARAAVASAQASVQLAELDLERCVLRAPFAGRVREKLVDLGQYLNRNQAVARIYSIEDAEIRLPLSLDDLAYLDIPLGFRPGEGVEDGPEVQLQARVGRQWARWTGRVVRVESEVDSRTRMITLVVRVQDPQGRLAKSDTPPLVVGLFVKAEIEGVAAGDVVRIPRLAMRGNERLLVVDADDRLRFRDVDVIRFEGEMAVLDKPLAEGDRVCLSPLATPVDGMQVRPMEEELGL